MSKIKLVYRKSVSASIGKDNHTALTIFLQNLYEKLIVKAALDGRESNVYEDENIFTTEIWLYNLEHKKGFSVLLQQTKC